MPNNGAPTSDAAYLDLLLEPIRGCANYEPMMGQDEPVSLERFMEMYGEDPFYHWMGFDVPQMYLMHKGAGVMTSIYRQTGIGVERLIRRVATDALGLPLADNQWSYGTASATASGGNRTRNRTLDLKIQLSHIQDSARRQAVQDWMVEAARAMRVSEARIAELQGIVFEIRQGYKSADSKRVAGDVSNVDTIYGAGYLPCLVVVSTQFNLQVVAGYRANEMAFLSGYDVRGEAELEPREQVQAEAGLERAPVQDRDRLGSLYVFMREVVGYDLAAFFERNSDTIRAETGAILRQLMGD